MNSLRGILKNEIGIVGRRARAQQMSTLRTERLEYEKYGTPSEVLNHKVENEDISLAEGDVLVKFLASPVNPADINTIQGTYPLKPKLPAVGGGEGVAEVLESRSSLLQPGDWVLPARSMSGTWRTHRVCQDDTLIKVRNDIPIDGAATMMINPATALRMLEDFVSLKAGDWVLQNGANSAVGLAAIQICKKRGVKTINVVRDRDSIEDLKSYLRSLGADVVLTEAEARTAWRELPRPRLAFNCVGGSSSTELCKALGAGGTHVTYGGMSMKPVTVATSHLIFKDLSVRGFWLSRWYEQQGVSEARLQMFTYLSNMIADGELSVPPLVPVKLSEFSLAVDSTLKGFKDGKFIFKM